MIASPLPDGASDPERRFANAIHVKSSLTKAETVPNAEGRKRIDDGL
jgi:hypothetical protein